MNICILLNIDKSGSAARAVIQLTEENIMTVNIIRNGTELTAAIEGRLDTLTAPEFEEKLEPELEDTEKLVLDLAELEYISSAGLRVLLSAMKVMEEQGEMVLRNVRPDVMDVFEVTGFIDMLNIE